MHLRKKRDFACEELSHSRTMAFTATGSDVTERCNWARETSPWVARPNHLWYIVLSFHIAVFLCSRMTLEGGCMSAVQTEEFQSCSRRLVLRIG
jgi:hypothetical protein